MRFTWPAFALLSACGGQPRPLAEAGLPPPTHVEVAAAALPARGAFFTPGLENYADTARLPADPLESQLRQALQQTVEAPPSLDCLAREYAGRFAADGVDADPGAVQAMADRCGHWSRPAQVRAVTAKSEAALLEFFSKIPAESVPGPVGLGVARHPDGRVTGALLMPPGEIKLELVPRMPTGPVVLKGRLLQGDGALEIWVDDGQPREVERKADAAGRFEATLPPMLPGRALRVEVVRHHGRFRRTMGLLTLGVPRQDGYAPVTRATPGRPPVQALVEAVNAARQGAGRAPLLPEEALHGRLDGWMDRLAEGELTEDPPGIVDQRGWPFAAVRFGFGSGADAAQAVDLLLDTPTGRDVVLDATLDHLAVGTRPFADGAGFDLVVLGLTRFQGQAPELVRANLMQRLAAARGGQALVAAPALQALAQTLADEALAGKVPWKDAVPTLMGRVKETRPVKGGFGGGAFTAVDPGATSLNDEAPNALDPAMKFIGVGVAAGPLPGGGVPRHIIIYVVAEALAPSDG